MSDYIAPLICIGLVLSPLVIPVGVTVVDWIGNLARDSGRRSF